MPNRIIKESICTSENVDRLTAFQETAFVRLIVNCDDFGRFFGNPKILASRLFPFRPCGDALSPPFPPERRLSGAMESA